MAVSKESLKQCFYIAPIDEPLSEVRVRSDKILKFIVRPVCEDSGYDVKRADEIEEAGQITNKIIDRIIDADLVIADITGNKPNVYYEIAIRHFIGRPFIQIAEEGEKIPFDIKDFNTIFFNHKDLYSVEQCKYRLKKQIDNYKDDLSVDNPIISALKRKGIDINNLFISSKSNTLMDLKEMVDKIFNEMQLIKNERDTLISNIVNTKIEKDVSKGNATYLTGKWESNNGIVMLSQNGTNIIGEYQFKTKKFVGNIYGEIVNNIVVFHWNWKNEEVMGGIGYWVIDGNELVGGWWEPYVSNPDYYSLVNNPNLISDVSLLNTWNLNRRGIEINKYLRK